MRVAILGVLYGGAQLSHQIQITSKTNCSHQIQITHIKYKIKIKRSAVAERKLFPLAILFLHVVLSSGCFAATAEEMSTIANFVATAGKVSYKQLLD